MELIGNGKQLIEVSSCAGRSLADGIVCSSKSKFSTERLQVSGFINPYLSWKTSTKRKRSKLARRDDVRSKPETGSPTSVENSHSSDTEKVMEAFTGQTSLDNLVNLPIKKRRHFLQSLSPSESLVTQSDCDPEDPKQISRPNHSSSQSLSAAESLIPQSASALEDPNQFSDPSHCLYQASSSAESLVPQSASSLEDPKQSDPSHQSSQSLSLPESLEPQLASAPEYQKHIADPSHCPSQSSSAARSLLSGPASIPEDSKQISAVGTRDVKFSEGSNRNSFNSEGSSGSSNFEAAACTSCLGGDANIVNDDNIMDKTTSIEGSNASNSTEPLGDNQALEESGCIFRQNVREEEIECPILQNDCPLSDNQAEGMDCGVVKGSISRSVPRLHWDLNIPIDAWDQLQDDSVVVGEENNRDEMVSLSDCIITDVHSVSEQFNSKLNEETQNGDSTSCAVKSSLAQDLYSLHASPDDFGNNLGGKDPNELKASNYSCDWESRGLFLPSLRENGIGDVECMDYEFGWRDGEYSDCADYTSSEVVEAGSEGSQYVEKRGSSAVEVPEVDLSMSKSVESSPGKEAVRDDNCKMAPPKKRGLSGGYEICAQPSAEVFMERNDDSVREICVSDYMNVLESELYASDIEVDTNRSEFRSSIKRPLPSDITNTIDAALLEHLRSSYSQSDRDTSDKFVRCHKPAFHGWKRYDDDGQLNYYCSRSQFSYESKERRLIADSTDKFGGWNSHGRGHSVHYFSKGLQRPITRRQPAHGDDCYGASRRPLDGKSLTTNRGGYNSGNYPHGGGRGFMDKYRKHVRDGTDVSSDFSSHYISKRNQYSSPSSTRWSHISLPHNSRSGIYSLSGRQKLEERNTGTRWHSRSPEFMPEARMQKVRIPYRNLSCVHDHGDGFMSSRRAHFSPQQNRNCADKWNFTDNHLRHRRSPAKMSKPPQRCDTRWSSQLASDDYSDRRKYPRRIPHSAGNGRQSRFDNDDGDRIRGEEGEMRVRRSDTECVMRDIGHDAEDSSAAGN